MVEVLVPLGLFAMIASIVIVPRYLKSREKQKLHDTLRAAIERGAALPPEVVTALSSDVKTPPSPERDLRIGIIWVGVAAGLAAFGLALGMSKPEAAHPLLAMSAFPGFIGLAFVVLALIARRRP